MKKITSVTKLIALFIGFIVAMLWCRFAYSGKPGYTFLLWNLFLAWVPFQLSVLLIERKNISKAATIFLLATWLLFFPNALYIITDLVHLQGAGKNAPIWFDAILIFTSSVTGLILAFASLLNIDHFLQRKIRAAIVEKLVAACLFVGSFGVYLGRFLRWNSWEVVSKPGNLSRQVYFSFTSAGLHYRAWVVTLLLTCLFSLLYFTIKKLPGLLKEPGNNFIV